MVFHKHRLVFVAIPKTGTSSVVKALRNKTDKFDGSGHIPYNLIIEENDTQLMIDYHSFTIVRNPYDRFVSAFEHMKRNSSIESDLTISEMVYKIHSAIKKSDNYQFDDLVIDQVWAPQNFWVSYRGKNMVDQILKFENLNDEWSEFVLFQNKRNPISNLPLIPLFKENVGGYDNYKLTSTEKELIYDLYQEDFEMFNYKK